MDIFMFSFLTLAAFFLLILLFVYLRRHDLEMKKLNERIETEIKERNKKRVGCLEYIFQELLMGAPLGQAEAEKKAQELAHQLYNLLSGKPVIFPYGD